MPCLPASPADRKTADRRGKALKTIRIRGSSLSVPPRWPPRKEGCFRLEAQPFGRHGDRLRDLCDGAKRLLVHG
ncbi:hypothetical protein PSMK_25170 [Phycisphaera mikurensis NBRC 102666]|uniref:Uncharacterized protein n=1 Tax=Phycisphaera mikurensis (strain NBRC 102666 / KCTC 22515 / FYK2301M01) TaxID=1142394 RepID=I0IHD8_PHYMF|nr:hypothetical protein PSMK_25170 [Phycisphaera mikurensis NBRC 102666]